MERPWNWARMPVWLWQGDHSQGKLPAGARPIPVGQMIAGKRSGNPWLPEVRALTGGVDELVGLSASPTSVFCLRMQENVPMLTPDLAGRTGVTVYIIGPEGGFPRPAGTGCPARGGFAAVSRGPDSAL